jgi:hypothetical protein
MKSPYKNATKDIILHRILELQDEAYPFTSPVLKEKAFFWVYCNARRYWGSYKDAMKEAKIKLKTDQNIISECGYEVDSWRFIPGQERSDWMLIALECLSSKCVDISSGSLKNSPFFDIYTDAVILFGKYDIAIESANASLNYEGIKYPESKDIFFDIIEMYTCKDQIRKREILKKFNKELGHHVEEINHERYNRIVLIDGSNEGWRNNNCSIDNVFLIDEHLQDMGYRKENINVIFDSTFKYRNREKNKEIAERLGIPKEEISKIVNGKELLNKYIRDVLREEFKKFIIKDQRYCESPSGQRADDFILTKAYDLLKMNPKCPPLIITNDDYQDHLKNHPEYSKLIPYKKGVVWTYIQKKPQVVINDWTD